MRLAAVALAIALLGACSEPAPRLDASRLIDLTYTFDEKTVYWPNAEGFRHRKDAWTQTEGGYWYAAGEFASAEHGGTHMDSPIHFSEGKRTLDEIPLTQLVAPAVVIDVTPQTAGDRDYRVTVSDILRWEQAHRRVPAGSIAVIRTGWGRFWPDVKQYLGSDVKGDTANLHFPGLSREAAELLAARQVAGVGIDTASLDHGPSTDFIAHQVLNGANIYGIENLANIDQLPVTGAMLIVLPMKIGEGSGGPVRVVAQLP